MRRLRPYILASLASFATSEMSLTNGFHVVTYVMFGLATAYIRLADPSPPLPDLVLNGGADPPDDTLLRPVPGGPLRLRQVERRMGLRSRSLAIGSQRSLEEAATAKFATSSREPTPAAVVTRIPSFFQISTRLAYLLPRHERNACRSGFPA